jgi:hypothetical protein
MSELDKSAQGNAQMPDFKADIEKGVTTPNPTSIDSPKEDQTEATPGDDDECPDGGFQAWMVAAGAACVLFCTLGCM